MIQLSHLYGKTIALTIWTFVSKVMSLLFRFVIAFFPQSKHLLISWLQSPSAVNLEAKKIKSVTVSIFRPSICHEVMGQDTMILVFECWVLGQIFHSSLSPSSRGFLVPLNFLPLGIVYISEVVDISPNNLDSSLWFIQPGISDDILCT